MREWRKRNLVSELVVYLTLMLNTEFLIIQGSWKEKLRNRFKFIRRPTNKAYSEDETQSSDGPPLPKRQKKASKSARLGSESVGTFSDDETTYETKVKELQQECKKKKREKSIAAMLDMTQSTFKRRRQWILSETPSVSDILMKFPSFKHRKIVSKFVI